MKKALALLTVLCLASVATAELQVEVAQTNAFPGAGPGGVDLTQWTVYIVDPDGVQKCSSVDGQFLGPMNQIWGFNFYETVYAGDQGGMTADQFATDTHLLLTEGQLAIARKADEDVYPNPHPGGALHAPFIGQWFANWNDTEGQMDTFALGIQGAAQQTNLAFAQVVMPAGKAEVCFIADIARDTGGGFHAEVCFPEPASAGLLILGGIALVMRRRRS